MADVPSPAVDAHDPRGRRSGAGIVGILLAAGRGERFGGDKRVALLEDGKPMAVAACRTLVAALGDVVAVVRPEDAELAASIAAAGAKAVACPDAHLGMGHSLACGIGASADAKGWVIALADMPWVAHSTIEAVARAVERGASIAAPRYRGRRGHPVGFGPVHRDALRALEGDRGARALVERAGAVITLIDVDDPGVLRDVDVPGDLR